MRESNYPEHDRYSRSWAFHQVHPVQPAYVDLQLIKNFLKSRGEVPTKQRPVFAGKMGRYLEHAFAQRDFQGFLPNFGKLSLHLS